MEIGVWATATLICAVTLLGEIRAQVQQVPVCASIPGSLPSTGSQLQGPKGDFGYPGKKGPKGERGFPGHRWGLGGCPSVTFHLPRDNQVTDYIRYRSYFPNLKEATMCAWVELNDRSGTIASYAASRYDNGIVLQIGGTNRINLYIAAVHVTTFSVPSWSSLGKFHFCEWFSSSRGEVGLYFNGVEVSTISYNGAAVVGGGDFILGNDQDGVNAAGLDPRAAFSGNLTNFMIWPRVLTGNEIGGIVRECDCPVDYAVAMTLDRVELHGEAHYSIPEECPTL